MNPQIDVTGLGDEPGGAGDVTGIADAIASAKTSHLPTLLLEHGYPVAKITPVTTADLNEWREWTGQHEITLDTEQEPSAT